MKLSTALRQAVWRNDATAVEELLQAGAKPDVQDEESGWSCMHHALYWGHLGIAVQLLAAGPSMHLPDHQGRTPLDLLSRELQAYLQAGTNAELFAWGNGASFQLGTGGTGLAAVPIRLDVLQHANVVALAAAKFHSAAVTAGGKLLTWGWGRGGRLGHADFDIHSGESATIVPRPVAALSRQVVVAVAAAKHHTAAITAEGDLFTWGANRHSQLGYNVDTQPTPRKITTIRVKWAGVAAANKHTVAVSDAGAVFSWGDNSQGQLGYGTTDSAANANPRIVEAMKGKRVTAVAAAKRHTVARTAEGDVWTWGHCGVSPRRVQLAGARDVLRTSGEEVVFHKGQTAVARPLAVRIAAGAAHSSCLTQDGVVLVWRSADPLLQVQEASGALAGRTVVDISAGKYRTAAVTKDGSILMWEGWSKPLEAGWSSGGTGAGAGARLSSAPPAAPLGTSPGTSASLQKRHGNRARAARLVERVAPAVVHGLKRAACVAVGEKHSLALQHWCCRPLDAWPFDTLAPEEPDMADEDSPAQQEASQPAWPGAQIRAPSGQFPWETDDGVPSLQRACERAVARQLVEPRSVCGVLQYADAAGATMLRHYCLAVAIANLDAVLLEARDSFEVLPEHLLAELEGLLHMRFELPPPAQQQQSNDAEAAEPGAPHWYTRRPTAAVPPEDEGSTEQEGRRASLRSSPSKGAHLSGLPSGSAASFGSERSFKSEADATKDAAAFRQVRHLRKKLQQIEALEVRASEGEALNPQQAAKVAQRPQVVAALAALAAGASVASLPGLLAPQTSASEPGSTAKAANSPRADAQQFSSALSGRAARQQRRHRRQRDEHVAASAGDAEPSQQLAFGAASSSSAAAVSEPLPSDLGSTHPAAAAMQTTAGFTVIASQADAAAAAAMAAASAGGSSAAAASPARKAAKPPRKGGLSLFLRGDLEKDTTAAAAWAAAVPTAPRGWGLPAVQPPAAQESGFGNLIGAAAQAAGATTSARSSTTAVSSLTAGLAAQRQEADSRGPEGHPPLLLPRARSSSRGSAGGGLHSGELRQPSASGQLPDPRAAASSGRRVSLADFVSPKSAPIPMRGAGAAASPAWGTATGASPPAGAPSLRDIQAAQEQHRESVAANWMPLGTSPHQGSAPTASWRLGASPRAGAVLGTSPGALFPAGTSPGGSSRRTPQREAPSSKWFVPEEHVVVPLREIERQAQEEQIRAQEEAEALAAIAAAKAAAKAQRRAEAKERARAAKAAAARLAATAAAATPSAVVMGAQEPPTAATSEDAAQPAAAAAAKVPARERAFAAAGQGMEQAGRRRRGSSAKASPGAAATRQGDAVEQPAAGAAASKRRQRSHRGRGRGGGGGPPTADAGVGSSGGVGSGGGAGAQAAPGAAARTPRPRPKMQTDPASADDAPGAHA